MGIGFQHGCNMRSSPFSCNFGRLCAVLCHVVPLAPERELLLAGASHPPGQLEVMVSRCWSLNEMNAHVSGEKHHTDLLKTLDTYTHAHAWHVRFVLLLESIWDSEGLWSNNTKRTGTTHDVPAILSWIASNGRCTCMTHPYLKVDRELFRE